MASIRVSVEGARGCGYRKPGGLYLVSEALAEPCPLLPIEMAVCPTCGEGIKPARGFTWVDPSKLVPSVDHGTELHVLGCPFGPDARAESPHRMGTRAGLIWVGEAFYKTPDEFTREAAEMGVSRRIAAVPRGFKVGETWVLLGHRKAIEKACSECGDEPGGDSDCPVCSGLGYQHRPGIISAFLPTAVEYIVKGTETEKELDEMEKRGLSLVKVERAPDPQGTFV